VDVLLTPTLGDRARLRPPWLLLPQAVLALAGAPAVTVMALLNGQRLNVPRAHQLEVLVAGVVLTAATYALVLSGGPYVGPAGGAAVFALAYRRQRARDHVYRATGGDVADLGRLIVVGGAIFALALGAQFALFVALGMR
jgi:hypothetical protein